MGKIKTNEERVAKVLVYSVNDLTLDLELVGEYVAELSTFVQLRRLEEIMEVAREERDGYSRDRHQDKLAELARDNS